MSIGYPERQEILVPLDAFYRASNGKATLNSRAEFWHAVALALQKRDDKRTASARRVAQYARLLARAAAERDATYRAQIEALNVGKG